MEIVYNRHSVGGSNYHLQFTPKYRRAVFRVRQIKKLTEALIRKNAYEIGIRVEAIEFGPDHMHVFVSSCRRYSVSTLVNHLKGYSSWYIRRALLWDVSAFLWGDSFWSDGFFYESVGRVTSETVKFYIERQQGKHWTPAELDGMQQPESFTGQRTLDSFGS